MPRRELTNETRILNYFTTAAVAAAITLLRIATDVVKDRVEGVGASVRRRPTPTPTKTKSSSGSARAKAAWRTRRANAKKAAAHRATPHRAAQPAPEPILNRLVREASKGKGGAGAGAGTAGTAGATAGKKKKSHHKKKVTTAPPPPDMGEAEIDNLDSTF